MNRDGMPADRIVIRDVLCEEGMTMLRLCAASFVLLAGAAAASADDIIRLGGTFVDDADTQLVHRRGYYGGYYGGYHRGYYGGYYSRGYYGHNYGYRSYSHYGYRPYYGYSYYRPYVYGYGGYSYYRPIAAETATLPEVTVLGASSFGAQLERPGVVVPRAKEPHNGTYLYDGGPRVVVPMPDETPAPGATPRPTLPREGKFVSLPPVVPNAYPAYGDALPRRVAPPVTNGTLRLVSTPTPRVAYPAYGDSR
jgi:hypothetical protein